MNDHGCDGHVKNSNILNLALAHNQRRSADKMPGRASKRTIRVFDTIDPILHDTGPVGPLYGVEFIC